MKIHFLPVVLATILLSNPHLSYSQSEWVLRKDKAGIRIYTQKVKGSDLEAFKGITTAKTTVGKLVKVLRDVDRFTEWLPDCETAELHESDENTQIHYLEIEAPFPVSNRDSFQQYTYQHYGDSVKVIVETLPDYGPQEKGIVRIPYSQGFWLFEQVHENQTRITYQMHADPGGSIPDWLANAAVIDNPYQTLENLKDYLTK